MSRYLMIPNRVGALLIEALLSVVILSISLTLIIHSLLSNLRVLSQNGLFSSALINLENKMDFLILKGLNQNPIEPGIPTDSSEPYQYVLTQTPVSDEPVFSALKKIHFEISWKDKKHNNNIAVDTYILDSFNEK